MKARNLMVMVALVALVVAAALCSTGCSQLQARSDAATSIDAQAAAAPSLISQVDANEMTAQQAQALLGANASTMSTWSDTATVNWFAYVFGGRLIFVNQDYKDDLSKSAARFADAQRRATSQPADAAYYLRREEVDFQKFKLAKDGANPKSP